MGSPIAVVRHLIWGTEITWGFLTVISSCQQDRLVRQFWRTVP